jgi:fumarate reductase subunit C
MRRRFVKELWGEEERDVITYSVGRKGGMLSLTFFSILLILGLVMTGIPVVGTTVLTDFDDEEPVLLVLGRLLHLLI